MKTQTKLLVSFGLVSVIIMMMASVGVFTLRQLSSQSQTVYSDYTVPLAEFAQMGTALTKHHQILLDIAAATKQADFAQDVTKLLPLKTEIEKAVTNYKSTTLRASRSGRDETRDLALFEPALKKYFQDSEGALSAMADSFDRRNLSSGQADQMRALGVLAITVNLTPSFEIAVKRHN
ncbi:MAG: MCP four helix bundle domain-containing protein, partial [Nitrospira sp.]|nr:MCP four helix bundle domain-containing protein [Nitrospira sp.]